MPVKAKPSHCKRAISLLTILAGLLLVYVLFMMISDLHGLSSPSENAVHIALPPDVTKLHIDIGPNFSPRLPPMKDSNTGLLVVEPNVGIVNTLREHYQKRNRPNRFFTLAAAVSGEPLSGGVASFRLYDHGGQGSSLAEVHDPANKSGRRPGWADPKLIPNDSSYSAGTSGVDIVPVISLERLLSAIPPNVSIPFLKTDGAGFDLSIIKSASLRSLQRVKMIKSTVYIGRRIAPYRAVQNNLKDWTPYMRKAGFKLSNKPPSVTKWREWAAVWKRMS